MPPLAISKEDLRRLVAITAASIRAAHDSAYGSGAAREAFAEHALTEIPRAA